MKSGFSLVELSIVLVILGLLVGGVLSGAALIRASELRSVTTQYQNYKSAVLTFRDKYIANPGDMNNATAFWGKDNANCSGDTGTAVTNGTCNGNQDGVLQGTGTANTTAELYQVWRQLALAGVITGIFSGTAGPVAGGVDHVPGVNSPQGKFQNSGWGVGNLNNFAGDAAPTRTIIKAF